MKRLLLIALLLWFPSVSHAAIAFDATSEGNTTGTSYTLAHTTSGTNRLLLVHLLTNNTTDIITGITYAGVSMSRISAVQTDVGGNLFGYVYGLVNPASGTNNIVVSASASSLIGLQDVSYTGVAQTGLPDATQNSGGVDITNSWTAPVTTVADNAWHFVAIRTGTISTVSGGGINRLNTNFGGVQTTFDSNAAITPAGVHNITGTSANATQNYYISVSFAPASAAPPATFSDIITSWLTWLF